MTTVAASDKELDVNNSIVKNLEPGKDHGNERPCYTHQHCLVLANEATLLLSRPGQRNTLSGKEELGSAFLPGS